MRNLYCLFATKPSISAYTNKLTLNLSITTHYRFQIETNTPIKTNSNNDYTASKKKVRMLTRLNFINKGVGEANS
jgi:hypothetical protein